MNDLDAALFNVCSMSHTQSLLSNIKLLVYVGARLFVIQYIS